MTSKRFTTTPLHRQQILAAVDNNLDLVSEERIERDFLTDSLMHKVIVDFDHTDNTVKNDQTLDEHIHSLFEQYFGFPYLLCVSQGRLAEALLSKNAIKTGNYIPCSALFATTHVHQLLNGGTPINVMCEEAFDLKSDFPFKGNIDLKKLDNAITTHRQNAIPYIYIEPCNNAMGGHPMSMQNMIDIKALSHSYGIPIYIDAARIIDNAVLIQRRESGFSNHSIKSILRQFCDLADGCTMSATKNFPTSIGGFFATRDKTLLDNVYDDYMLLGSGLSYADKIMLASAMCQPDNVFANVSARIDLVKQLHTALNESCDLVQPAGAHGVYLDTTTLNIQLPESLEPVKSLLHHLFCQTGIRGAQSLSIQAQPEQQISLIRLAIPIVGYNNKNITAAAKDIIAVLKEANPINGLEKVSQPCGLSGSMRAKYRVVEASHNVVNSSCAYSEVL